MTTRSLVVSPLLCCSLSIGLQTEEAAPEAISIGDLRSVGECHEQCIGGCHESHSASSCFKCKHLQQSLRNRAGFKCVTYCDDGFFKDELSCKKCSPLCHTCTKAEVCDTCPGAQLLIDVDHFAHWDHGQCVENCPEGLVADYESNLIQARCVLKENLCGEGYFLGPTGRCAQCDEACQLCHGAGPIFCDKCASGFGNRSVGYCRPCCTPGQKPLDDHCEDCSASAVSSLHLSHSSPFWSFVWLLLAFSLVGLVIAAAYFFFRDDRTRDGIEYAPLSPHYNAASGMVNIDFSSDSDSEDEILKTSGQI